MRRSTPSALLLPALLLAVTPGTAGAQADSTAGARGRKSGAAATAIAAFTGGGGHIYAGEPRRGALIMLGSGLLFAYGFSDPRCKPGYTDVRTCDTEDKSESLSAASMLGALGIYGFGVWDAHRAAARTNRRLARVALGPARLDRAPRPLVAADTHATVRVGLSLGADLAR